MKKRQANRRVRRLEQPRPNCSAISNEQLQEAIAANWPVSQGFTLIPYGFSAAPFLLDAYYQESGMQDFILGANNHTLLDRLRPKIREVLDDWADLSQGALQFTEVTRAGLLARGIFFYFADLQLFTQNKILGLTIRRFDNNAQLMRSFVFLPQDELFWDVDRYPSGLRTAYHEVGHALGFDHLHEFPAMQKLLNETVQGVFCSVMPYIKQIETHVSQCLACIPSFAVEPGPLDEELVGLSFIQGRRTPHFNSQLFGEDVRYNAIELTVFSFLTIFLHHSFFNAVFHCSSNRQNSPLPKVASLLVADVGLLAAMLYLGLPPSLANVYLATGLLKYLSFFHLPSGLNSVLSEELSLSLFNVACIYNQGQLFRPLAFSTLYSVMGTYLGSRTFSFIQDLISQLNQKLGLTTTLFGLPQAPSLNRMAVLPVEPPEKHSFKEDTHALSQLEKIPKVPVAVNSSSFFSKESKKRVSLCERLTSWAAEKYIQVRRAKFGF
jgi:hypothetical protein